MERESVRELDFGILSSELYEAIQMVLSRYDDDDELDNDVGLHEPQKISKGLTSGRKSDAPDINININVQR